MLSKVEIDILRHLHSDGLTNQMDSRTIKNISKGIDLNYRRTRDNVMRLLMKGYVELGYTERQSRTYFINRKGVEMLNE